MPYETVFQTSLDRNSEIGTASAIEGMQSNEGLTKGGGVRRKEVPVTSKIGEEAMLVLTRKRDDFIKIGSDIVIRVMKTSHGSVKIGIDAPSSVRVLRGELATVENHDTVDLFTQNEAETLEDCVFEAMLVQS